MEIFLSDLYPNDPGPSGATGPQGATGPTPANVVFTTGNQTISGIKTFRDAIILKNASMGVPTYLSDADGLQFKTIGADNYNAAIYGTYNGYQKIGISFNITGEPNLTDAVEFSPFKTVSNVQLFAPNLVYNTGNQTISGLKDFTTRPTVNTIPVALSGEAASSIEQLVKNDSNTTIYKGQPVYVSGSNGNNILIHPASNSGEGTSSKTFGLLKQTLLNNEQGYVVTEGSLFNVDTSMATEGDPVWLGPTGNLIYGLVNKPKAPQHLVSLGFVERAHQNQGKIFVKVQNGFELEELHNVRIVNEQNSDIIIYNSGSGLWLNSGVNFGSYYTNNNPSGYITGLDLSNYYTKIDLAGFYTGSSANNWTLKQTFTGNTYNYYLGNQVISPDGSILILSSTVDNDGGANAGAILIYTGNNNVWNFKQKITGASGMSMGRSVKINSTNDIIFAAGSGSINIYTGTVNDGWFYKQNVTGAIENATFGNININESGSILTADYGMFNTVGGILIFTGNQYNNWNLKQNIILTSLYQGNPGHHTNQDSSLIISNGNNGNTLLTFYTGNAIDGWSGVTYGSNPVPRVINGNGLHLNKNGSIIYAVRSFSNEKILDIYTGNLFSGFNFAFNRSITGTNDTSGTFSYMKSSYDDSILFIASPDDDIFATNNGSLLIYKNISGASSLYQKIYPNTTRAGGQFSNNISISNDASILVASSTIDSFFQNNTGIVSIYSLDPDAKQFTFEDDVIIKRNLYVKNRPIIDGAGVLLSGEAYLNSNPSGFITGIGNLEKRSLNQSFRNIYISSQFGSDSSAQIGNINLPFQTAQTAWSSIPAVEFSVGQAHYILNFYEGSYSINVNATSWPSTIGIRGLGPRTPKLTLTHNILSAGVSGPDFNIKDWGDKSVELTITSQGGNYAGGLNSNGGNGGNITLNNCLFNSIASLGGNASNSNRDGVCGSIYLENCKGGTVTLQNGSNGIGLVDFSPNQTALNTKASYASDPGGKITWNFKNSEINFPSQFFSSSNRYFYNTENTRTAQQTYHFNTEILSGNRNIKNLELSANSLLSGNVTGIILTDNITGRNKLGYRNSAFVADFASGIYLFPFVESPNLVYNTGNQTISGTKTFNSAEIKSSPYHIFSNNNFTIGSQNDRVLNIANSTSGITGYLPEVVDGRMYKIKNINVGTVILTGSNIFQNNNLSWLLPENGYVDFLGIRTAGYTGWVTI